MSFDKLDSSDNHEGHETSHEEIAAIERHVEFCERTDGLLARAVPDTQTGLEELQWKLDGMNIYISTKENHSNENMGTTRKISLFYTAAYLINDKQELRRLQYSIDYTLNSAVLQDTTADCVKVSSLHSTFNIFKNGTVADETKPSDKSEGVYDKNAHEELMAIIRQLDAEDGITPED